MGPVAEQWVLLLLEAVLGVHCIFATGLPSWLLLLCAFLFFFLCNHFSWQLLLGIAGFASSRWVGFVGALGPVLGLAGQVVLPIPPIRRSTQVPIGRRSACLTDPSRTNAAFVPGDNRPRRINLSFFYPCVHRASLERHELFDHFSVVGRALVSVLPAVPDRARWILRLLLRHVNGPSSAYKVRWGALAPRGKRLASCCSQLSSHDRTRRWTGRRSCRWCWCCTGSRGRGGST